MPSNMTVTDEISCSCAQTENVRLRSENYYNSSAALIIYPLWASINKELWISTVWKIMSVGFHMRQLVTFACFCHVVLTHNSCVQCLNSQCWTAVVLGSFKANNNSVHNKRCALNTNVYYTSNSGVPKGREGREGSCSRVQQPRGRSKA